MHDVSALPRLPTRCPLCKGAVIERQPSPPHGAFIWFHCFFCNHWWKFRLDTPSANPNWEIAGEVLIVTKGGMRYTPALVTVNAMAESPLKKHLESKRLQAELECQRLNRDIVGLTARLRIAKAEDDRLWEILQRDQSNSRKAEAWSVAYNRTKKVSRQIEELQTQRQYLTSGDYFLDGLPSATSTARTDANGKFTLIIPRAGRYGLVARASRELFKDEETYFWFVWVSSDGEPVKRLTLGNDNIMGAGSPDSALL
jgi:hypothetical protein